jgi:hypothetical protein
MAWPEPIPVFPDFDGNTHTFLRYPSSYPKIHGLLFKDTADLGQDDRYW